MTDPTWQDAITFLNASKIRTEPSNTTWYRKAFTSVVEVIMRSTARYDARAIIYGMKNNPALGIERMRCENRYMRIYCKSAPQVINVVQWLLDNPVDGAKINFVQCPYSDSHGDNLMADFPTVVRNKLYAGSYRYRIFVQIPYGTNKAELKSLLADWVAWEEKGDGKMSSGAVSRLDAPDNDWRHYGSGQMSFYTNDTELSFIMKLTYPNLYSMTEKAVLLSEVT